VKSRLHCCLFETMQDSWAPLAVTAACHDGQTKLLVPRLERCVRQSRRLDSTKAATIRALLVEFAVVVSPRVGFRCDRAS